jgi:hypothetical protein
MKRNYRKRSGEIMSPEGKIVQFNCITDFALENELSPTHITQLLNGQRFTYKGWQAVSEKPFKLKNHNGIIYEFKCLVKFCNEHNVKLLGIIQLLRGRTKHHQYWVLPQNSCVLPPLPPRINKIKSPTGKVYTFNNICEFCRQHNLERSGINKLLLGYYKNNKAQNGWSLV